MQQVNNPHKQSDTKIPLKGSIELNVANLLNHSSYTKHFIGGKAVRCILMPTFYHHFHAPVSGQVIEAREDVSGHYFDDLAWSSGFKIFENYRRGYYIFKTKNHGYVGMVSVGIATIGSVVFEPPFKQVIPSGPVPVQKGDKLGHFAYGGSLVILLFEPGRFTDVAVHQGQRIGVFEK